MRIDPKDLESSGYVLMDQLDHQQLILFVREYLRKATGAAMAYTAINLLILAFVVVLFWMEIESGRGTVGELFTRLAYGMAIAFALVPIHELIHGIAYKGLGAPRTSYAMNLPKFYFLAMADRFVANRREFRIVALAPFMTITLVGAVVFAMADLPVRFMVLGMVMTHTAFCSGDFGLLSYFEYHAHRDPVTYDDRASGLTFFYGRPA